MFREMRRSRQALPQEEVVAILDRGTHGVLALAGDEGYPYALPISYVYADGKLYFHCARSGHKLDAISRCPKASFCVVDQDQVVLWSIPPVSAAPSPSAPSAFWRTLGRSAAPSRSWR